ncbi:MAG TPA: hypothetical protein VK209_10130 [Candidatus Sulfotelmatobacter sp.]|nr:hypothetical protein [Candidatus Sulfotelmatobacter sp.]
MQESENKEPTFESGKVILSTGDLNVLEVNLTSKKINVDLEDKNFIKRIIAMRGEISQQAQAQLMEGDEIEKEVKKKPGVSPLKTLRSVAEALHDRGITLTVSYKGGTIITIGAEARSTILQLITKTRAVAVNSFINILRIII